MQRTLWGIIAGLLFASVIYAGALVPPEPPAFGQSWDCVRAYEGQGAMLLDIIREHNEPYVERRPSFCDQAPDLCAIVLDRMESEND